MAFKRVRGNDDGFDSGAISSITVAVGDALAFDRANNVLVLATSSTSMEDLAGVAVEAKTTSDTSILYQRIDEHDEYVVDTTNNSNASMNFERMVLTDENEVNNTGSDSTSDAAIFIQIAPVGATADKKIRGRFVTKQDRA